MPGDPDGPPFRVSGASHFVLLRCDDSPALEVDMVSALRNHLKMVG